MTLNVLVCDDEPLARERLQRMVDVIEGYEVIGVAANGKDAIAMVEDHSPDIVLLDIRMPAMDGIETARHLLKLTCPPAVIFCTAYDEYAVTAFEVQAIGYLMKPVRQQQLVEALDKAHQLNKVQLLELSQRADASPEGQARTHISARTHRGIELIPIKDVRFFMAEQKYVTANYGEGEVLIDESLKELEKEFEPRFVRIHRNALVAVAHIEGVEHEAKENRVKLNGVEQSLLISRRHTAAIKKLVRQL